MGASSDRVVLSPWALRGPKDGYRGEVTLWFSWYDKGNARTSKCMTFKLSSLSSYPAGTSVSFEHPSSSSFKSLQQSRSFDDGNPYLKFAWGLCVGNHILTDKQIIHQMQRWERWESEGISGSHELVWTVQPLWSSCYIRGCSQRFLLVKARFPRTQWALMSVRPPSHV